MPADDITTATGHAFHYAVVRIVPQMPREEFVNVGVVLFCDALDYLAARIEVDAARLLALAPDFDLRLLDLARDHLEAIPKICVGGPDAGSIGALSTRERWHWIVSPRSTLLQTSAPHAGLCVAPDRTLESLMNRLVRSPATRLVPGASEQHG